MVTCDAADYPHNCDSEYLKLLKYFDGKCFDTKRARSEHNPRYFHHELFASIAGEKIKKHVHFPALYACTPPIYYSRCRVLSAVFNVLFFDSGEIEMWISRDSFLVVVVVQMLRRKCSMLSPSFPRSPSSYALLGVEVVVK